MSTQTIEFATNKSNNWFTVCYDWNQCQSILAEARKLGVIPSAPRKYTHPNVRWVIYFNSGVTSSFVEWIRSTFSIKNVQRVVGAMRSEAALKHENAIHCQRANISRYSLSEVKSAMIQCIGTPAEIRELFDCYNIKVNGVAGLPQCLELIEELDKFDEILAQLRKPKEEVVPEIVESLAIVPFIEAVEGEIVDDENDEYIDIDSVEFNDSMLAIVGQYIQCQQLALPAGADNDLMVDFQPWTAEELSQYTIKEIIKLAELDGINLSGKKRIRKADLVAYILPALNSAALAAHLA
jgi:hypothetical protein